MELRQQRGLELAATRKIRFQNGNWVVPSQTGDGRRYQVHIKAEVFSCTCLDHETRGIKCKHVYAATYVMERNQNPDGTSTVTETLTVEKRPTYPQNWSAYNAAQTHEQDKFQTLLADLCSGLMTPPAKTGRPRLPLSDAVFNAVFKVYSTVSQRRFMSDLREAQRRGLISKVPHFNSISNYLENPELMPILRELIHQSALPLKARLMISPGAVIGRNVPATDAVPLVAFGQVKVVVPVTVQAKVPENPDGVDPAIVIS